MVLLGAVSTLVIAVLMAATLSPIKRMTSGLGPMNLIWQLAQTSAKCVRVFDVNLRTPFYSSETLQESLELASTCADSSCTAAASRAECLEIAP